MSDSSYANPNLENSSETSDSELSSEQCPLTSFRREWKRELETSPIHRTKSPSIRSSQTSAAKNISSVDKECTDANTKSEVDDLSPDVERKAAELFTKAVELERSGLVYEAIRFYRKSMSMVPDIEFIVHRQMQQERSETLRAKPVKGNFAVNKSSLTVAETSVDLVSRFAQISEAVCAPNYMQDAIHISCLPPEMIERILCWVIGNGLDLQSLEKVSCVSRGFYLAARNPDLWHKACQRIWGRDCGGMNGYSSWREMFILHPHPRYNGCYISRTTYFRHGETGFQDDTYQPWYAISYYRYVRFFPDGVVFMLTSSDEPTLALPYLKLRDPKNTNTQMLTGHYHLYGSKVVVILCRKGEQRDKVNNRRGVRRCTKGTNDVAQTLFRMEFDIRHVHQHLHWQLHWCKYTIVSTYYDERQNVSSVDVTDSSNFPPMAFSRVRSFVADNDFILD